MRNNVKSKAEERFAAAQKLTKQIRKEQESEQQQRMELTAKLRALRLEKEAADKILAEEAAAKKAATGRKKSSPSPRAQQSKS